MKFAQSNPATLALTIAQYGTPVYGPDDMVWYYESEGTFTDECAPDIHYQWRDKPFTIRWYTGDCSCDGSSIYILVTGLNERQLTETDMFNPAFRSSITRTVMEAI